MLAAIIPTHESERVLVPTLSALVHAAVSGLLTDVVIADGGSRDATREVADVAGARFLTSQAPLGIRLAEAARTTRTPWLLFLRPGTVPEPVWIGAVEGFMALNVGVQHAAAFRLAGRPPGLLARLFGAAPSPSQGLLISRTHYDAIGAHRDGADAETDLMRRAGGRRMALLGASALPPRPA